MQYSPMENLKEFHDTFTSEQREDGLASKINRRGNLIQEEEQEVQEALDFLDRTDIGLTSSTYEEALIELAKELADLLYVIYGTAEELNIPLQDIFNAVHRSNMGKIWQDGKVHYNKFGKVIKPPEYRPPDLSFINE